MGWALCGLLLCRALLCGGGVPAAAAEAALAPLQDRLAVVVGMVYRGLQPGHLPPSPHPLGASHSFAFTNFPVDLADAALLRWTHVRVNVSCTDRASCAWRSKLYKIYPAAVAELRRFDYVLYQDTKVVIHPSGWKDLLRYVARAPGDWALIVRHHEFLERRQHGLDDELAASFTQKRYRQHKAQIMRFIDAQKGVFREGIVHNSGLLIWRQASVHAEAVQHYWYNATMATSPECQLMLYFTYQRFTEDIITIVFPHEGIYQWGRETMRRCAASLNCSLDPGWWRAHRGGALLPPTYAPTVLRRLRQGRL